MPISVKQVWDFLSIPKNLKTIVPDYVGFDILSGADRPMFAGQMIQYIEAPFMGIKTEWIAEITHVADKHYFCRCWCFPPTIHASMTNNPFIGFYYNIFLPKHRFPNFYKVTL